MTARRYTVLHLFAGIGGGALGFKAARARLGALDGVFENIGGVDCDEKAIEDYTQLTGTQGTVLDLFTAEDYEAFHGEPPPDGWREATPADIAAATGGEAPDVVFLSPPCKSFSGLLPKRSAKTAKYQALSRLVVRGLWLTLEAFQQRPKLIILENVPRIQQRGRALLDRNIAMLHQYGYAVQETTHNCGEIGGLAAHRKRFLLVARHTGQVAPFLYEPPKKAMRTLGDEILRLPLPFDPGAGPMHHLPKLKWKTWLRLALVPAGGDWRDLQTWAPGTFDVARTPFNNVYRVLRTDEPAPTVTGGATPTAGGYSVADPRLTDRPGRHTSKLHVGELDQPARTVTGARVGSGTISVSDPRLSPSSARHTTKFHVADPARPSRTVTGTMDVQAGAMSTVDPRMSLPDKSVTLRMRRLDVPAATVVGRSSVWDSGGQSIPDPRPVAKYRNGTLGVGRLDAPAQTVVAAADIWTVGSSSTPDPRVTTEYYRGTYGVRRLDQPASTVTGNARESTGAFSVPDVRVGKAFEGTYGVANPDEPSVTVTGKAQATTGRFSVPDVRLVDGRPEFWPDWVPIIISPHDGCMHRPLTTLELYALQGFDATNAPKLAGRSVARWRTAIGNAVPPPAAQAVAETMLMTLLANEQSQQPLPTTPIWVAELPLLNRVLRVLAPDEYPSEVRP